MANPTDSAGNIAIDFQWGNFPIQPDDQRVTSPTTTTVVGGDQNVGWTYVSTTPSAKLAENDISVTLNNLVYSVEADNHVIAYENWSSYPGTDDQISVNPSAPAWSQITFQSGSQVREDNAVTITVPNVLNKGYDEAVQTLTLAGFDVSVGTPRTTGATAANHDTVYSQSIAAGTANIKQGADITIVLYKFHDATSNPNGNYNG